jgi:hypothetical protein
VGKFVNQPGLQSADDWVECAVVQEDGKICGKGCNVWELFVPADCFFRPGGG